MKEPPQRSDSVIDLEHRFRQTDLEAAIDDSGAYGANVQGYSTQVEVSSTHLFQLYI